MAYAVVNKVKEIASGALDAIKNFFGIHSPSRVMSQMGNYMMEGLQKGIEKTGQAVVNSTKTVATNIAGAFSPLEGQNFTSTVNADVADVSGLTQQVGAEISAQNVGAPSARGVVINQTNNVNTELDMEQVNRNLTWELNKL